MVKVYLRTYANILFMLEYFTALFLLNTQRNCDDVLKHCTPLNSQEQTNVANCTQMQQQLTDKKYLVYTNRKLIAPWFMGALHIFRF